MKKNAKAAWKPRYRTCKFVCSSDVFDGLSKAYDAMTSGSSLPFTWGDNNRSLVNGNTIARVLDDLEGDDEETAKQLEAAIERLRAIGDGYVDMEN